MNSWTLVVDDDAANLRVANRILTADNIRVSCVKSGEEALKFLHGNRPDLILLDIHMPGMNGYEAIAALKENDATADIPVIFLTADDDSSAETKGLQMGSAKDTYTNGHSTRVADTYDAMTSRRSYRDHLPQPVVRAGLEKGIGSQFAPEFARIMMTMMDEDIGYRLREM